MKPITLEEVGSLISDFGLVDLDRCLVEARRDKRMNVQYVAHGDELAQWMKKEDTLPRDEIIDAPFLADVLICHINVVHGCFDVLHFKFDDDILSFPFVNDGDEWIPAPMTTLMSKKEYLSKSFLPPRLSDAFLKDAEDIASSDVKHHLGRLFGASLLLALQMDDGVTLQ